MATSDIENKVINATSLFDKVSAWGLKNTGRTKIGYAVSTYEHALDALKQSKIIIEQTVANEGDSRNVTPTGQTLTRDYSSLVKSRWSENDALVDGFLFRNGTLKMYQGLAYIFDFMSFIVELPIGGKQQTMCVSVKRPADGNISSCLLGTHKQIPNDISEENIKRCEQVLGSGAFVVGVGLSFTTFCTNFMSTYFPDAKLDAEKLKSYAAQGKLFAEISIPTKRVQSKQASSANVIHAMVSCDVGGDIDIGGTNDSQLESAYKLWFPYPLMLLNDYNDITTNVKIDTDNGQQIIGEGDVKFPLASSNYNHKKGLIYDFSPKFILDYCSFTGALKSENYTCGLLLNGSYPVRVRLYLDPSLRGTDGLPNDDELYQGQYDVSKQTVMLGAYAQLGVPKETFRVLIDVGHLKGARTIKETKTNLAVARELQKALGTRNVFSDIIEAGEILGLNTVPKTSLPTEIYNTSIQGGRRRIGAGEENLPWDGGKESHNDAEIYHMIDIAKQNKDSYVCMVSIHCDAGPAGSHGARVFYHLSAGKNSISYNLANSVAGKICDNNVMGGTIKTARLLTFTILTAHEFVPTILVLCGFYTDENGDWKKLNSAEGQKQIGEAIAAGIILWYNANKR